MAGEGSGFASLQLEASERPLEQLGRCVALGDEGLGALAQMIGGGVAGVTQHAARVNTEQQLDLVDPVGVQRRGQLARCAADGCG